MPIAGLGGITMANNSGTIVMGGGGTASTYSGNTIIGSGDTTRSRITLDP